MPTQVQIRRAIQATQEARTLAVGELDFNTTDSRLSPHDGATAGGVPHLTWKDSQNNEFTYAAATGTNAIAITLAKAPAAYAAGQSFKFKAANTISGSATLNVNSLGAKTLKKKDVSGGTLAALTSGDIIAGAVYTAFYDGTDMILESIDSGGGGWLLVDSTTSTSPTLTLDGNIESYKILVKSMTHGTTNGEVRMHLRRSSTSQTFIHQMRRLDITSSSTTETDNEASDANILLCNTNNVGTHLVSGEINLPNLGGTQALKTVDWNIRTALSGNNRYYNCVGSAYDTDSNVYNEVTFSLSSGSFSATDLELWGYSA